MDRRVFFQISSSLFYYVRIALNLYKFNFFLRPTFFYKYGSNSANCLSAFMSRK